MFPWEYFQIFAERTGCGEFFFSELRDKRSLVTDFCVMYHMLGGYRWSLTSHNWRGLWIIGQFHLLMIWESRLESIVKCF